MQRDTLIGLHGERVVTDHKDRYGDIDGRGPIEAKDEIIIRIDHTVDLIVRLTVFKRLIQCDGNVGIVVSQVLQRLLKFFGRQETRNDDQDDEDAVGYGSADEFDTGLLEETLKL